MKKLILAFSAMLMLVACDNSARIVDCVDGCSLEDDITVVEETSGVEELIEQENAYRELLGQNPLSQGLKCTLYTVPNGTSQIVGATLSKVTDFIYKGTFNQPVSSASDGLNVLPSGLRSLYTSWFVVRCTGKLVVEEANYYQLDLTSDDGANLYVGGSLLINNDGNHAPSTKSASKLLRRGVTDFRLDYMQGPAGQQALILKAGGELIPAANFYF